MIGRSDRPQIEVVDFEGRTTRIVVWEEAHPDVTDAFWAAYDLSYAERRPGLSEPELSQRLDEIADRRDRTHYLPHFGRRFVSDDLGNIWVPEFGPDYRFDQRYRVFSSEGEWVGWVHMPDRFQALDIRDGRMLGVHLDQFSVPAVAVYRLEE